MKRVKNSPLGNDLWFDGLNYWRGQPGKLIGPFTESELTIDENVTGEDSTIVDSGEVVVFPRAK